MSTNQKGVVQYGREHRNKLLFLPDLNFELKLYKQLLFQLSEAYHVIAISLPGSDSVEITSDLSIKALYQYIRRKFEDLGLCDEKMIVFAHGVSSGVLNFLLPEYPSNFEHIVLVNPPILPFEPYTLHAQRQNCCSQQIDLVAMEQQFVEMNFPPHYEFDERDLIEKNEFYEYYAEESITDAFTQIVEFCFDRQIKIDVFMAKNLRNMKFNEKLARELYQKITFIAGYNYCFQGREIAEFAANLCKEAQKQAIQGDVEISI